MAWLWVVWISGGVGWTVMGGLVERSNVSNAHGVDCSRGRGRVGHADVLLVLLLDGGLLLLLLLEEKLNERRGAPSEKSKNREQRTQKRVLVQRAVHHKARVQPWDRA